MRKRGIVGLKKRLLLFSVFAAFVVFCVFGIQVVTVPDDSSNVHVFSGSTKVSLDDLSYEQQVERAQNEDEAAGAGKSFKPREVVVVFKDGVTAEEAAALLDEAHLLNAQRATIEVENVAIPTATVEVVETSSVTDAVATLEDNEWVESVQPNYIYELCAEESGGQEAISEPLSEEGVFHDVDTSLEASPEQGNGALVESGFSTKLIPSSSTQLDDPALARQWYLNAVNAYAAWDIVRCEGKVTIAIIDSGIELTHPDLQSNIVSPRDLVGDERTETSVSIPDDIPDDQYGHGTHVAGIAGACSDNGVGISGVSYNANIMPLKVFYRDTRTNKYVVETKDLLAAYNYILGDAGKGNGQTRAQYYNVRVVNMSLGRLWVDPVAEGGMDAALFRAIDRAYDAGILTVCAAGNSPDPLNPPPYKHFPSDYETCVSVIALSSETQRASFSNYGPEKDISAPGAQIYSCSPYALNESGYRIDGGTSMASPVVSGIAALVWAANPRLTPDQVKNILYTTSEHLGEGEQNPDFGSGRVDALEAVITAQSISATPVQSISAFPTEARVGVPLVLHGVVTPAEANQRIVFTLKDSGTTQAVLSGGSMCAQHEGVAILAATVVGGNSDGSNYVQEFEVTVVPAEQEIWKGDSDTTWYNPLETTFVLHTPEQLAGLAEIVNGTAVDSQGVSIAQDTFVGKTVKLESDIYLNSASVDKQSVGMQQWNAIGALSAQATDSDVYFDGTFDGQGHVIYNIYIDGSLCAPYEYGGYQGFFGALGENALVTNMGLSGGWIFGRVAGGIAAVSRVETNGAAPRIVACYNTATIENPEADGCVAGGIFGGENKTDVYSSTSVEVYRGACRIISSYNAGMLHGGAKSIVGGVVGTGSAILLSCYNSGEITSNGGSKGSLAGLLFMQGAPSGLVASDFFDANARIETCFGLTFASCPVLYRYLDENHSIAAQPGVNGLTCNSAKLKNAVSQLGSAFVSHRSGGFPLLYWQEGAHPFDISKAVVEKIPDQIYTGQPIVPSLVVRRADPTAIQGIVLRKDIDYVYQCSHNTESGKALVEIRGVGRYVGTLDATFVIGDIDLADCFVDFPSAQWYYGDPACPSFILQTPQGVTLEEGVDYSLTVQVDEKTSKASVVVTGVKAGVVGSRTEEMLLVHASDSLFGKGTQDDPYQIASKADLQFMSKMVNERNEDYISASYDLMADIDATNTEQSPLAVDPIGVGSAGFSGVFDGKGHSIILALVPEGVSKELNFDSDSQPLALFGSFGNSSQSTSTLIKNLTLDGSVENAGDAAAFVGAALTDSVTFEHCVNKVQVTAHGMYGSGFVDYIGRGSILTMTDCVNDGVVSAEYGAAGLVSELTGSGNHTFYECANRGPVVSGECAGGLVALFDAENNSSFTLERCGNLGSVACRMLSGDSRAGGLLGSVVSSFDIRHGRCSISLSYNRGSVTASSASGGLVGFASCVPLTMTSVFNHATITNTNNDSARTAARAGGMIGVAYPESDWVLSNVYSAGVLRNATEVPTGALFGWVSDGTTIALQKAYYVEGLADDAFGGFSSFLANPVVSGVAEAIPLESFTLTGAGGGADLLGATFADDAAFINEGLPVLAWQKSMPLRSLESVSLDLLADEFYTGEEIKPAIRLRDGVYQLVENVDYTVAYRDNIQAGTGIVDIRGQGGYQGNRQVEFTIKKLDLSTARLEVFQQIYTGEPLEPPVNVVIGDRKLQAGTDYDVTYSDNIEVGNARVTIRGKGNYTGSQTGSFLISLDDTSEEPSDDEALLVYTQLGESEASKRLVCEMEADWFKSHAQSITQGGYLCAGNTGAKVIFAESAITIEDILSEANIDFRAGDAIVISDEAGLRQMVTYEEYCANTSFWPAYRNGILPVSTDNPQEVPGVIALSWAAAPVDVDAGSAFTAAILKAKKERSMRFLMGLSEENYCAGNYVEERFVCDVVSLTVVKSATELVENPDGSFTTTTLHADGSKTLVTSYPNGITITIEIDSQGEKKTPFIFVPEAACVDRKAILPFDIKRDQAVEISAPEGVSLVVPISGGTVDKDIVRALLSSGEEVSVQGSLLDDTTITFTLPSTAHGFRVESSRAFRVVVNDVDDTEELSFDFTAADLDKLTFEGMDLARGQYYKSGMWHVFSSDRYVLIDTLFKTAGAEVNACDIVSFMCENEPCPKWYVPFATASYGMWYPWSAPQGGLFGFGQEVTPFVLALSYSEGVGQSIEEAYYERTPQEGNMVIMGIYPDDSGVFQQDERRLEKNVATLFVRRV